MATPSELLTSCETAIATVLTALAAGDDLTEIQEGPLKIKRASPELLLKALRELKAELQAEVSTDRRAGVMYYGGAQ